jgi:hypothetical protein
VELRHPQEVPGCRGFAGTGLARIPGPVPDALGKLPEGVDLEKELEERWQEWAK